MKDKKEKLHDSDDEGAEEGVIEMVEKKAPEDPNMVRDKRGKLVSKHEFEKQELKDAKVISFRERSPAAFIFNPTR